MSDTEEFYSEEEDSQQQPRFKNSWKLEECLEMLYKKNPSNREKALLQVTDKLTYGLQHKFVEKKCITLLHLCLTAIKKGPNKEICLASRVIGLLSITVGSVNDLAHEVLENSLSPFTETLQSCLDPLAISSLLECLVIITFVGANGSEETERSMEVIWKFICLELGGRVATSKSTTQVLKTAISSWSFLLATIQCWNLNSKIWKGSICEFTNELNNDDVSVRIALAETLALIFELGDVVKFYCECERYGSMEEVKNTIQEKVRDLSIEEGDDGSTRRSLLKKHKTLFHDLLQFLMGRDCPKTTVKVGRRTLKLSSWSQMIQVNYLKQFLGGGFLKHAQENELLQDFLDFRPKERLARVQHDALNDEEATIHYVFESGSTKKGDGSIQRKAKTQLLNKQRQSSQAKNVGRYAVSLEDED